MQKEVKLSSLFTHTNQITEEQYTEVFEKLRKFKDKHNLTLWVFGSYAKRTANRYSDVDVYIENHLNFLESLTLVSELKHFLNLDIDVALDQYLSREETTKILEKGVRVK